MSASSRTARESVQHARLDRAFLLRHALGELLIAESYRTRGGVTVLRASNTYYMVTPARGASRPFRLRGRRPTDADLWALVELALACETAGNVDGISSNRYNL